MAWQWFLQVVKHPASDLQSPLDFFCHSDSSGRCGTDKLTWTWSMVTISTTRWKAPESTRLQKQAKTNSDPIAVWLHRWEWSCRVYSDLSFGSPNSSSHLQWWGINSENELHLRLILYPDPWIRPNSTQCRSARNASTCFASTCALAAWNAMLRFAEEFLHLHILSFLVGSFRTSRRNKNDVGSPFCILVSL